MGRLDAYVGYGELEAFSYKNETDALKELFRLEKENPTLDVVLVKADTSEEIRMAFRNYFSDAKDFVRLLAEAIEKFGSLTPSVRIPFASRSYTLIIKRGV